MKFSLVIAAITDMVGVSEVTANYVELDHITQRMSSQA